MRSCEHKFRQPNVIVDGEKTRRSTTVAMLIAANVDIRHSGYAGRHGAQDAMRVARKTKSRRGGGTRFRDQEPRADYEQQIYRAKTVSPRAEASKRQSYRGAMKCLAIGGSEPFVTT